MGQLMQVSDSLRGENPAKAFELAREVLKKADLLKADSFSCAALNRLAQTQMALGSFDGSIQYFDSFLNRCGREYPRLFLAAQINRASLYTNLQNFVVAEEAFKQAEELADSDKHVSELLALHQSRARLHYFTSNYEAMRADALKAQHYARVLRDEPRLAAALTTLGLCFASQGNTDSASYFHQQALIISQKVGDSVSAMHTHINLADLYGDRSQWDSAQYHIQVAQNLANALGHDQTLVTTFINESYSLYNQGNYQLAFDKLDEATSIQDSLVTLEQAKYLEDLEVRYKTREKQQTIEALQREKKFDELKQWSLVGGLGLVLILVLVVGMNLKQKRRHEQEEVRHHIEKLEQEKSVLVLESMLYAQEEERQRIAKDLHDGIGALLSTARMQINKVEQELDKLQDLNLLKNTETIISQASKEVRRVSHNMMPGVLMELGLAEGIEDFLEKQPKGLAIDFVHEGLERRFSNELEIMVFRIVQELINNTNKHSNATQVDLSLVSDHEFMTLEFHDNGRGFKREEWDKLSNLGLNSIRSRAHFLKGRVTLETEPNKGVLYTLKIPLEREKA